MKYIAGNEEFIYNMRQLLPDLNIFNKIILENPTNSLKGVLWDIEEGKYQHIERGNMFRSCTYIQMDDRVMRDPKIEVTNTFNGDNITGEFDNWGILQISDSEYLFFIWLDTNQNYKLTWDGIGLYEDLYIKVVI